MHEIKNYYELLLAVRLSIWGGTLSASSFNYSKLLVTILKMNHCVCSFSADYGYWLIDVVDHFIFISHVKKNRSCHLMILIQGHEFLNHSLQTKLPSELGSLVM